jgi:hypothetical protein
LMAAALPTGPTFFEIPALLKGFGTTLERALEAAPALRLGMAAYS